MARWLAQIALVATLGAGCGAPARTWSFPTRVFRSTSSGAARATRARNLRPSPHATPAAALIERALHQRGLRFGTDGTLGALHGYLREHGRSVPPARARPGDVLFFDLGDGCGGHAGLVDSVDPDGRITFREAREGVRKSFADAGEPTSRRDSRGRVLNTFLRPKHPDDPPDARYYAGDMLCAVLRIGRE
jgi:hypothetical protein